MHSTLQNIKIADMLDPAFMVLTRWGITPQPPTAHLLGQLLGSFSRIPYENMTKIVQRTFRSPEILFRDYLESGTGGTCFSLVDAFSHLLTLLRFEHRRVLADRTYGNDTHAALVVRVEGKEYLADPGFLIFQPIDMSTYSTITLPTGTLSFTPVGDTVRAESIGSNGHRRLRYTLKRAPVDEATFRDRWADSFEWEMMTYPVVTAVVDSTHIYLRGRHLQIRKQGQLLQRQIPSTEIPDVAATLGIQPEVSRQALDVLGIR